MMCCQQPNRFRRARHYGSRPGVINARKRDAIEAAISSKIGRGSYTANPAGRRCSSSRFNLRESAGQQVVNDWDVSCCCTR